MATPFDDVTGLDKPTFDTIDYGLAIAAVGLTVWTAASTARRRANMEPGQ